MEERKQQIQVGVLFILSILVLVFGVLWFKNYRLRAESARVVVEFPSTSGLLRGDPVEVRGVPAGQVREIRYSEGKAEIVMDLDKSVKLTRQSRISIENIGIMGQKRIAIEPGPPGGEPVPLEETVFQGEYEPGISELVSGLGGTLEVVNRLADRLDRMFATFDTSNEGSLGRTLKNTEQVTAELATFLRESRGELSQSVRTFSLAMNDLHQTLDGREESIGELVEKATVASVRLDSTLAELDRAAVLTRETMQKVNSGDGTLSKMVNDEALYVEMTDTIRELRALVADVKENPKRYVRLSLF